MKDRNETPNQKEARLSAFERDERPVRKTSDFQWTLNNVDDIEWKRDDSGIYVLINWDVKTDTVRLDVMGGDDEPIISFAGSADNVRKHVGRWIDSRISQMTCYRISAEHAAYIGSELEKADIMRIDYIQDGKIRDKVTSDNPYDVPASKLEKSFEKTDSELLEQTERENKLKADDITAKYENNEKIGIHLPEVR